MEKGEDCILLDNSDPQRWRVRNSKAAAGVVPSICLTFPPPDPDCKKKVCHYRNTALFPIPVDDTMSWLSDHRTFVFGMKCDDQGLIFILVFVFR